MLEESAVVHPNSAVVALERRDTGAGADAQAKLSKETIPGACRGQNRRRLKPVSGLFYVNMSSKSA
jgi:hypothetical protein